MSAVVARLDRLEGAHFDARGPADFGAAGSTTIETPGSVIKVCSSAQVSSSTGPSSAGDVPTAECEPAPLSAPAHSSPQTVVDYIDTPPSSLRKMVNMTGFMYYFLGLERRAKKCLWIRLVWCLGVLTRTKERATEVLSCDAWIVD